MAQTIWIHKLADAKKVEADGMDYICEHLFQGLTQAGKLTKAKGWNPLQNASAKDGTTYRALFCDSCEKELQQWQREAGKRAGTGVSKRSNHLKLSDKLRYQELRDN